MPDERVVVYIDGSNLYHSCKQAFGKLPDVCKLRDKLVGDRRLVRSYYYTAPVNATKQPEVAQEQQRFIHAIQRLPYSEVRQAGRLVYPPGWPKESATEKGVDVQLVTDMLTHCFKDLCDTCILVSGDTDYAPALQSIKDAGKHIEVALFPPLSSSQRLRDIADRVIELDATFMADCWR